MLGEPVTIKDRISLTWRYGAGQFLVGGIFNISAAVAQALFFSYSGFVDAFIIKLFVSAVAYYLVRQFQPRDFIFFYINLGLSRRGLQASVFAIDFLALAVLSLIVFFVHG